MFKYLHSIPTTVFFEKFKKHNIKFFSTLSQNSRLGGIIKVHSWPPMIGKYEVHSPILSAIPSALRKGNLGHSSLEIIPYEKTLITRYGKSIYLSMWGIETGQDDSTLIPGISESYRIKPAQNISSLQEDIKLQNRLPKSTIELLLSDLELNYTAEEALRLIQLSQLNESAEMNDIMQWTATHNCTYFVACPLAKAKLISENELEEQLYWTPMKLDQKLKKLKMERLKIEQSFGIDFSEPNN